MEDLILKVGLKYNYCSFEVVLEEIHDNFVKIKNKNGISNLIYIEFFKNRAVLIQPKKLIADKDYKVIDDEIRQRFMEFWLNHEFETTLCKDVIMSEISYRRGWEECMKHYNLKETSLQKGK